MNVKVKVLSKENIPANVVITGIVALAALEVVALFNGSSGALFTLVVAVIAGAVGVVIPTPKVFK